LAAPILPGGGWAYYANRGVGDLGNVDTGAPGVHNKAGQVLFGKTA